MDNEDHDGARPHHCDACGEAFESEAALEQHVRAAGLVE